MGAVPRGSGLEGQQGRPSSVFTLVSLWVLSGGCYVPHFKDEEIQILSSSSLGLTEMPGAQEHCWSYLVLCSEIIDWYPARCKPSMNILHKNKWVK